MGRSRKASLINHGTGRLIRDGVTLPGYYVRYSDYQAGQRVQRSKHFSSQRLARKWARRYTARIELGSVGEVIRISLGEAADEWTDGATALARTTVTAYNIALGLLEGLIGEQVDVCDIDGRTIDRFIAARMKESTEATAAKHVRHLHAWFEWAIGRNYHSVNPVDLATTRPSNKHVRVRPHVSREQLDALVTACDTEDRKLAIWLAITTGLDRAVIEHLCPSQIDLADRCIRIQRPKTARRVAKVIVAPLHASLAALLAPRCLACPPSSPVLSAIQRQDADHDWWQQVRTAAGVPNLLFRDLRAMASALLQRDAGISLPVVSRLLGHQSIQTTAGHYTPPDPDALQRLDRLPLPGIPRIAGSTVG